MRQFAVLLVITAFSMAPAMSQASVTFINVNFDLTASWSGGDPIFGETSGSSTLHANYDNPDPSTLIFDFVAAAPNMQFAFRQYLYDDPSAGSDVAFGLFYNAGADTSTHTFSVSGQAETIFHLNDASDLLGYPWTQNIAPFTYCRIEQGNWDGTTFSPTGLVMDLAAISSGVEVVPLNTGYLRFCADVTTTFQANASYGLGNSGPWRHSTPVPEPGSMIVLAVGGLAIWSRRRKQ